MNTTTDTVVLSAEELSEEDQQLKSELEMLVERLQVCTNQGHWNSMRLRHLGIKSRALQIRP